MAAESKALDIFGIVSDTWSLREYDDYYVGDKIGSALTFSIVGIELSESTTRSLHKINIELYIGVGKIIYIDDYDDKKVLVFDCGIYAFSFDSLPEGIESGSYVRMIFYLLFDEDYHGQLTINNEPLFTVIPGMVYDWRLKDILIWAREGEKGEIYFEDLPVEYVSPYGEVYKRIRETNTHHDCGGYTTSYILVCEML
ncbi:hypothetical protein [Candidatus Magnetominusculus dajiuhuensis]|uniref:hypothetical protein n=1 Tax=Candidatus Magnetominusculus dajiuhuensis TaxID=3137712 RepID=UPI003B42A138